MSVSFDLLFWGFYYLSYINVFPENKKIIHVSVVPVTLTLVGIADSTQHSCLIAVTRWDLTGKDGIKDLNTNGDKNL